jgi:hypothetical protein
MKPTRLLHKSLEGIGNTKALPDNARSQFQPFPLARRTSFYLNLDGIRCSDPGERRGTQRWYRRVKATKRGGTEGEESESTDSADEVGEPAPGDPAEGTRWAGLWGFLRDR